MNGIPSPFPRRRDATASPRPRTLAFLAGLLGFVASVSSGCGPDSSRPHVIVYAAQDRVHAEALFATFTRASGIEVRAVYDNEATKTTGLANRILAERERPQADVWWSNEEMRTRQLVQRGVLDPAWSAFGSRQRVFVCHSNRMASMPLPPSLAALTNAAFRGQVAMAYPLFGTTASHLLVLRQRWGPAAWDAWCANLRANRPLLVDGNSTVVRRVAAGDAWLGLTDTDDVEAARREGVPVVALPMSAPDSLEIPNTVALVQGARNPEPARRLAAYLQGAEALGLLVRAGALSAPRSETIVAQDRDWDPGAGQWESILADLDPALRQLEGWFGR